MSGDPTIIRPTIIRGDRAPSRDSGTTRIGYDGMAADYDATLADWRYEAPTVAARLIADRLAEAGPLAEARVLDVGCGTGLSGQALATAGIGRIDGVDLSEDSLALAAAKGVYATLTPVDLNAEPGPDGRRLPMADDGYDGLVCVGVMTYLHEAAAIAEFARVVRPGGWIVFTSRDDLWAERGYPATLDRLAAEGRIAVAAVSEPMPYLPGNPDFAEKVRAIYATLRVPERPDPAGPPAPP
jgi:predicted TPR repeat methyltransferase